MTDLHPLLDRATEHVVSPDLAGRALAAAHSRRVRRTAVGALAAVVLLGSGVAWTVQEPTPKGGVVDTPSPGPEPEDRLDALMELPTPPAVPDDAVQPPWDPRTVAGLPQADIALPDVLEPPAAPPELTSIPAAAALVEEQGDVTLVDRDGGWWRLSLPEQPLDVPAYVRTSRLSTDGTRVVFLGRTSLWSRDVRSTRWREVAYPDGFLALDVPVGRRMIPQVVPMVAEHLWIARGKWWFVDLDTGSFEVHPTPGGAVAWGGGDVYVETGVDSDYAIRLLAWGPLGRPVRRFRADAGSWLGDVVADSESVAVVRGACSGVDVEPGLRAMDLDDLSTHAHLPVEDPDGEYACSGALEVVAWLDPDTVLASVRTLRGPETGQGTLFTWDVVTGELRRASRVAGGAVFDVARMAVGVVPPVP